MNDEPPRPEPGPPSGAGWRIVALLLVRGMLGAVTGPLHPSAARTIAARVPVAPLGQSTPWSARTRLSLALLTFNYATVSYVQCLFFCWIEHSYKTVLQLGNETARRNSTLLTVAMRAGMMAGGWLCDRLIRCHGRRVGTAGLGLAAGICLLGAVPWLWIDGAARPDTTSTELP